MGKESRSTQTIIDGSKLVQCKPVSVQVDRIKQKYVCGCGLAALEVVLKYYGVTDTQVDFLADNRIRRQVERADRGLREGTLGILALRRGFKVVIYSLKPRLTRTFFKLGGKIEKTKPSKHLIFKCLRRGIPPVVLIPKVSEPYEHELEEIGHYVVISGIDHRCHLQVADPQYAQGPRQDYWDRWSSSLIEIRP